MKEERLKILEMVKDGIISVDEAEELLQTINNLEEDLKSEKSRGRFKNQIKEELEKAKSTLKKAKNSLEDELDKVDVSSMKEKLKDGVKKVDEALKKVDDAILKAGKKVFDVFKEKEEKKANNDVVVEAEIID